MRNYRLANIVLMDDDSDDRQLFNDALFSVSPGCVLQCYGTCNEAFYEMRKHEAELPDVIFLDLMMPGVNGYACVRLLKQDILLKGIPVVVLSSLISSGNMDKLYDYGASFFITKPASFQKLKDVIGKMVNMTEMYDAPSRLSFFVNPEV